MSSSFSRPHASKQAACGVVAGITLAPQFHRPGIQLAALWGGGGGSRLAGSRLLFALRRLCTGFAVVAALKEGSKPVLLALLPLLYRAFPLRIRRLWQPPVHNLAAAVPVADAHAHVLVAAGGTPKKRAQQQQANGTPARMTRAAAAKAAAAADGTAPEPACAAAAAAAAALPPADPRLAELPHNAAGRPWDVDVTTRFFGYAAIGVAVAGVAPTLFAALGW